ncbi:MAG: DUF6797 domain-containing protein, partial [Candidatus Rokuibacteriota bacterium]
MIALLAAALLGRQYGAIGLALSGQALPSEAKQDRESKWEQMDYGPFLTASISMPGGAVVPKGVVVNLGGASVCFDTDHVRYAAGWTGGWLALQGPPFDGNRNVDVKTRPAPKGDVRWVTRPAPGWAKDGGFRDPRAGVGGPLPADWAKWKGLYVHGDRVVFAYT